MQSTRCWRSPPGWRPASSPSRSSRPYSGCWRISYTSGCAGSLRPASLATLHTESLPPRAVRPGLIKGLSLSGLLKLSLLITVTDHGCVRDAVCQAVMACRTYRSLVVLMHGNSESRLCGWARQRCHPRSSVITSRWRGLRSRRAPCLTLQPGGASHPLGSFAAPRYHPPCVVISAVSALAFLHGQSA